MHKTRYDHLFMFGLGALLLSACASLPQAQNKPEIPYLDWGVCPYECCTYGDWAATETVDVFKSRDINGQIAFRLQAGEKVTALDGVSVTHKAGVSKIMKPVNFVPVPGNFM